MIFDNVLRYIKIDKDGTVVCVFHKTANNEAVRVVKPTIKRREVDHER